MNWVLFMQFAGELAGAVAESQGTDQRAAKNLQLLAAGVGAVQLTDIDLARMRDKYRAEIGKPISIDELDALDAQIKSRNASIEALRPGRK